MRICVCEDIDQRCVDGYRVLHLLGILDLEWLGAEWHPFITLQVPLPPTNISWVPEGEQIGCDGAMKSVRLVIGPRSYFMKLHPLARRNDVMRYRRARNALFSRPTYLVGHDEVGDVLAIMGENDVTTPRA